MTKSELAGLLFELHKRYSKAPSRDDDSWHRNYVPETEQESIIREAKADFAYDLAQLLSES